MRNAWCDTNLAGAARHMRSDWRLTPGEMTVYRAVREPSGRWVEGRVDEVPLLHMWVYADGNRDAPLASSWADTRSGRVGWDAQHIGGGRCKVPTAPPFD